MKPRLLHTICAYPEMISWGLGACALDAAVIALFAHEVSLALVVTDWQVWLYVLAALVPASLLGCILGMFTCWPFIRILCGKVNGAPLTTGDRVIILSGPCKGVTAEVSEIITGQGGWPLAQLTQGRSEKGYYTDIFEEYSLLKITSGDEPVNQESWGM